MSKEAVIRASALYRSGGKVLRRVAVGKESLSVESNGSPIVALLPYAEYEEFKRERAAKQMRAFLDQVGTTGIPDAEVEADVLRAVQEGRHSSTMLDGCNSETVSTDVLLG